MASTTLVSLRLLRTYRGYRAGEQIQATPRLAETLVGQGVAEPVAQSAGLFDPRPVERAVATPSVVETR